jgi:hypothetical protein
MQYSQTGELEQFLDSTFGTQTGMFLEIGCWDGYNLSQTLYLEQKGWRGLCVDPFLKNFSNRTCMVCNKAVSADGKDREFVWVTTDRRDGGDVSYLSGFKDSLGVHWEFIREFCNYTETKIETITMQDLYRKYKLPSYMDFLSVDTEGAEVEIFSNMNLDHYRYGVISFEHNLDGNVKQFIGQLLSAHGYRFSTSMGLGGIEDVYISEGLL